MRKKPFIVLAVTLFFCITLTFPGEAHSVSVSLKLLDNFIAVGESFDVEVWANESNEVGEGLLAFGFDVFSFGDLFSYDGYVIESGFDNVSNPIDSSNVSGMVFPAIDDADVLLATISFSAGLVDGVGTLSISGIQDGLLGLYYEFSTFDISDSLAITINVNPVPEPSTAILLGAGCIAGLAFFRRGQKS